MKYHHLTATVNGVIADVLISQDEYDAGQGLETYFLSGALDVEDKGIIEITGNTDYLPDVIG